MTRLGLAALVLSVGLGLMVVGPARAQQSTNVNSEAEARQKIEHNAAKNGEAYIGGDGATYARQFADDGVLIAATGQVFRGREAIAQAAQDFIKRQGGIKSFEAPVDEVHVLPDGTIWDIGHATLVNGKGSTTKSHWAAVHVPNGSEVAIRMLMIGIDPSGGE
jgi:uncharacterized protein (TIGR02246 family)